MSPATVATSRGAPLWRRFAALAYDLLLLAALSMAYGLIAILLKVWITGERGEAYVPMLDGPLFQLGWLAVIVGFYCYFWRNGGQTLGMRAWRLKLTGQTSAEVTLQQCLLRCLSGSLALGLAGIGYWWAWFDPQHHCLHDRFSHTAVAVVPKAVAKTA